MRFTLLFFLSFYCVLSHAQKVDLDKYLFRTNVISLPEQYVEKEKRTYQVQVNNSSEFGESAASKFKNEVKIPSYTLVDDSPTVNIKINLNTFKFLRSEIKERVEEQKDDKGKVTRTSYYKVKAYWDIYGRYDIYGPYKKSAKELEREEEEKAKALEKEKEKNEAIKTNAFLKSTSLTKNIDAAAVVGNIKEKPAFRGWISAPTISDSRTPSTSIESKSTYESAEYGSYQYASDNFAKNFNAINERVLNLTVTNGINTVNYILNTNYGYYPNVVNDFVWILDSKKHPEYETQKQALDAAKILFNSIKATEPVGQIANDFQPLIDYFESLPEKYKTDDKADKKMRYSAYFNLAKIYYYLDMPNLAIIAAEKLKENDYDAKDGEKLIKQVNFLKNDLDNLKLKSQHFSID
jgi:hypothetical protein